MLVRGNATIVLCPYMILQCQSSTLMTIQQLHRQVYWPLEGLGQGCETSTKRVKMSLAFMESSSNNKVN